MNTLRRAAGIMLLLSPFLVLFGLIIAEEGVLFTLIFIAVLAAFCAIIFIGAWLAFGD